MQVESQWTMYFSVINLPFIKDMGIFLSFSSFVVEVLKVIEFAHYQLLPNSSGFIKAFEMICEGLDISLIMGIFFLFYVTKPSSGGWISLGGLWGKGPF